MKYETLLTELSDGVMTVTLNRPDKLNAFNTAMSRELIDFFGRVNAMDEVRAIVVTGAGRAFCAGADISGGSGAFQVWNDGNKPQKREAGDSITLAIFNCLKPIVAAINGAAVGVGITMCLPMDIRMMSSAGPHRLRVQQARHGDGGRLVLVPAAAGRHAAGAGMGDDGRAVRRRGGAEGRPGALGPCAGRASAGGPGPGQEVRRQLLVFGVAAAVNRRLMWSMLGAQDPIDAVTLDLQCVGYLAAGADAQEGIKSFFEKRAPDFP